MRVQCNSKPLLDSIEIERHCCLLLFMHHTWASTNGRTSAHCMLSSLHTAECKFAGKFKKTDVRADSSHTAEQE
eukprot:3752193-Amphidinium_carterae.1